MQCALLTKTEKLPNTESEDLKRTLFRWGTHCVSLLTCKCVFQSTLAQSGYKWRFVFMNQIYNLVLRFLQNIISALHCVVSLLPPLHPNTVHGGPPREAVCPALRSTKLGDMAVKQNPCASLSLGCQGQTSGMSPGDNGRLVAWFLRILTFVSFHVLYGNCWHWGWFGDHKGSRRSSFTPRTTKDVVETCEIFCLNLTKYRERGWMSIDSLTPSRLSGFSLQNSSC